MGAENYLKVLIILTRACAQSRRGS